jgi:hypothetical protein
MTTESIVSLLINATMECTTYVQTAQLLTAVALTAVAAAALSLCASPKSL